MNNHQIFAKVNPHFTKKKESFVAKKYNKTLSKMFTKKKKLLMWYEVHNLNNDGLNKSQISRQTDLDRATVRKYLKNHE